MSTPRQFELYDLRVTVVEIKGRSACGLNVGDYFEITESSRLRIPADKHFCIYALHSVLMFLPAQQRTIDPNDWMAQDVFIACPDPEEQLIMKIERIRRRTLNTDDLT